MTTEEVRTCAALIETLFARRNKGWFPILAFGFHGGGMTWAPKAEEGSHPPGIANVARVGAWGGAVETLERGFNCQPVQLLWAGIDVDAKNGQNEAVKDVPRAVAEALPEAQVRTSSSGKGAHVFLHVGRPSVFTNKAEAQRIAEATAFPFVNRLTAAGIQSDIVGRNQLWVYGGAQTDIQTGGCVPIILDSRIENNTPAPSSSVGTVVPRSDFGPMCNQILTALECATLIDTSRGVGRHMLHIKLAQEALRSVVWLRPRLTVKSGGTRLQDPNAVLSAKDGTLSLYSFVGGVSLFKLPAGL